MTTPQAPTASRFAEPRPAGDSPPAWVIVLGVGLAFGLSGWFSRQLALPPTGESPLQFQAGIALAGTLLWGGWRVIPGVALAEWLLRWWGQPADAQADTVLTVCLVSTAAASLQALVGAALVRRFVRAPLSLVEPRDIARFMLAGGFAACWVTPAIVGAWGTAQVATPGEWGFGALTGWITQSFGVCIVAPMVLALAARQRSGGTRRRLVFVLPVCVGLGLLVAMILGVLRTDRERDRSSFEREASTASSILMLELLEPLHALEAMRDTFTAAESVTRDGLRLAAKPWLDGPGHLQSIGFSAHVTLDGIPAFEARMRNDGVPNFKVFDQDEANSMRTAPAGDVFSMTYLEPPARSASRLGLNSLSIQAARHAILETVRTGAPAATKSFHPAQALNAPAQSGIVTYQAVYRGDPKTEAERIATVRGVALTTLRLDETLTAVVDRLPAWIAVCIVDVSPGEPRQRLAGALGCENPTPGQTLGLSRVSPFAFAGRSWELRVNASGVDLPGARGHNAWRVAAVGLLALSLLGALLLTVTGRTQRIEAAIEEARGAREAADLANAAKGVFLANMSHEIRTPMNAILGMSHLALKSGLDAQQHNYIAKVERSAQSLLGVIDDVLAFTNIEAGKLQIEVAAFDLGDVMDSLADLVATKAEDKGLELIFAEAPGLPTALRGDALRLTQVLGNLAGNAVKFTERGEVVVAIEETSRDARSCSLRFSVRDSGLGISEAQRQRLFRAFEQADGSASRRFGGSGLGLAISHRLIALMGGALDVRSTPGGGSEFFFSLRLERQPAPKREVAASAVVLAGTRLLVVDASPTARGVVLSMAAPLGLLAYGAADGQAALQAVCVAAQAGRPYDVVLVDSKLPGMDGAACARQLIAASGGVCPVALMTTTAGRDELLQRVEASELAVSDLLVKPVTRSRLVATCGAVLGLGERAPGSRGAARASMTGPREQLKGVHILLVEDNDINAELATVLLQDGGVIVTLARDGQEALDALERQRFDGVLMDCQMPVMDGYQATRAIRARPQWQSLPIIAMTANAMLADRNKALAVGMTDYIAKPINVNAMFQTLSRWVWVGEEPVAPTTAGSARDDELAALAGIDACVGRASTMGNDRLYRRLLLKFRDTQADFAVQFRTAARTADALIAKRLLHDLRATAGALGAVGVERLARALELAFSTPGNHAALETPLGALLEEIHRVNAGLRSLAPE